MVAFGQKIILLSAIIIFFWLCVGFLMYRSTMFTIESNKLLNPKTSEREILDCKTKGQKLNPGFWRRIDLWRLEIPNSVKESLSLINVESSFVSVQGTKVHYIYARPKDPTHGISVLLLHGQAFTSETWNEIGTIRILAALGYSPIAVDLPGYGHTPSISSLNKTKFMHNLITALDVKKPVIISPSMSGSFSLRYLLKHPKKIGGFIPISPVHTNILSESSCQSEAANIDVALNKDCQRIMDHLKSNKLKLDCIKVPSLIVWGERDRGENSAKLCLLPESQGAEIPNGKHPAYLSNPDLWHKLLYNFLNALREIQVCRPKV